MSEASATDRWVVAGYDGSDQARTAVDWAADEAVSRGCSLAVVHVVHWAPPGPHLVPGTDEATQELTARTQAERLLAGIAEKLRISRPELTVRTSVESGRAGETLARVGQPAELLVVGKSGRSALPRVVLGSTAAELLHTCDRPVVVVRPADSPTGPVVVGVDGSDISAAAVAFAFDFADRHGRELQAVHAWTELPIHATEPVGGWAEDWPDIRHRGEQLLDESLSGHAERHPGVVIRRTISIEQPARALLDTAAAGDAALLVVGSHGRGPLGRMLLGSVSHAMIYHAACPVAVVHVR